MIERTSEGYAYISNSGRIYTLLEGCSIGGDVTSDIIFIFYDSPIPHDSYVAGFLYGASIMRQDIEDEWKSDYEKYIGEIVDKFESEHFG